MEIIISFLRTERLQNEGGVNPKGELLFAFALFPPPLDIKRPKENLTLSIDLQKLESVFIHTLADEML